MDQSPRQVRCKLIMTYLARKLKPLLSAIFDLAQRLRGPSWEEAGALENVTQAMDLSSFTNEYLKLNVTGHNVNFVYQFQDMRLSIVKPVPAEWDAFINTDCRRFMLVDNATASLRNFARGRPDVSGMFALDRHDDLLDRGILALEQYYDSGGEEIDLPFWAKVGPPAVREPGYLRWIYSNLTYNLDTSEFVFHREVPTDICMFLPQRINNDKGVF